MTNEPYIELSERKTVEEIIADGPDEIAEYGEAVRGALEQIPWFSSDTIDWEGSHKNRALAQTPKLFELWRLEEYYAIKRGSVDPGVKELIALAVASEIECRSCVPYHSGAARFEGVDDDVVAAVQQYDENEDDLEDGLLTLLQFGVRSVYHPKQIGRSDIEELQDLGYDSGEILEMTISAQISFKNAAFNQIFNINSHGDE